MKKVVLIDEISGKEKSVELEFDGIVENELEIELLKRNFARSLVSAEWIEKGLAEEDFEEGFALKNSALKEFVRFSCEVIEREKHIRIGKVAETKTKTFVVKNLKTGEEKKLTADSKAAAENKADMFAMFAVIKKWVDEGKMKEKALAEYVALSKEDKAEFDKELEEMKKHVIVQEEESE